MKSWIHVAMMAMVTVAAPACVADDELAEDGEESVVGADESVAETEEDVAEAEEELSCSLNLIFHYNYADSTGTYRWHVSQNQVTGKWYVDERRIGGGFYKQYNLTPGWTVCPSGIQNISLKNGLQVISGPHNCLPDGREEVHLEKQRLLVPQHPFATYECL